MKNYQTLKSVITVLSFIISLNSYGQTETLKQPSNQRFYQNNRFEIGFTPRFSGHSASANYESKSPAFSLYEGIHRFQIGMRLVSNHYLHLCYDYFFRNVSNYYPEPGYNDVSGHGISIQYNYKVNSLTNSKYIKMFSRRFNILITPEIITTFGLNNMTANFDVTSLQSSNKWQPYWAFGTMFSLRPSRWFDIGLIYQLEYIPSIKFKPFRPYPQIKFNFKI